MEESKNIRFYNCRNGALIVNKETGAERFFPKGVVHKNGDFLIVSIPNDTHSDRKFKRVVVNSNGDYYEDLYECGAAGEGYIPIRKTKESGWQLLSEDFSSLSEEFFEVLTPIYNRTSGLGMPIVRKNKDSQLQFRNKQGELSQELYEIKSGDFFWMAVVKTSKDGGYRYMTPDFKLSEEYYSADSYYNSLAVVKKSKDSKFQFRDLSGNLSEEFEQTEHYVNGFAKVLPKNSSFMYRDLLGNLSKKRTQLGKDYFKYINRKITVYDLCDECFGDDAFLQRILQQEQEDLQYYCQLCETQEQLEKLYESSLDISDYVKGKAYDAYLLKTQQQQVSDAPADNKKPVVDDDALNKRKAELQESLQKMF